METYGIENLTFTYPGRDRPVLAGVSVRIERGAFVTICGASGCGKTTLLRQLKPALSPHGVKSGGIFFEGQPLESLSLREQSMKIGYVLQSPDNQIVTDKVWHELAFGLESLGLSTPEIRLRVAEMASFFGIQNWFYKPISELSGGQKQLLNLASVMAMQPSVLILDEPTSQLDPIAAGELLTMVGKINRELGVTVILTEHRLEEAFPLSDKVIVMEGGRVLLQGAPREAALSLKERGSGMFLAMPTAMRIWSTVEWNTAGIDEVPVTVRDGARWLFSVKEKAVHPLPAPALQSGAAVAAEWKDVWFKYEKNAPDVVKGLTFSARYGEVTAILGGNGAGKTTSLSLAARLNIPYRGKVLIDGQDVTGIPKLFDNLLGVLPQNPQTLFVKKTVREDLLEIIAEMKLPKEEKNRRLADMSALCRLESLLDSHPYDLSGGEQQRAALAKVLLLQPKILLLDEPTKGLDAEFKQSFAAILKKLTAAGAAVVMVSHDVEFCAEFADRCALFFDGIIVSEGSPREFFSGNSFYTTSANRMARAVLPDAVTVRDVVTALGGREQISAANPQWTIDAEYKIAAATAAAPKKAQRSLSPGRKMLAGIFAAWLAGTIGFTAFNFDGFKGFISGGSIAVETAANAMLSVLYTGIMLSLAIGIIGLTLALTYKRDEKPYIPTVGQNRKLPKRTIVAAAMILLLIPLTLYVGSYFFGDRKYYFISVLIVLETMAPFALVFESRKPQARELVIIAVLVAIAAAGRTAFFMLPAFKPVIAMVIISGVAFGGESGFLVGAMSMLVSNVLFGQGPWTPYQMFAMGVIGFFSGILFRKGLISRNPVALAVYGGLTTLVVYGGLMDPAGVLMYQSTMNTQMVLAAFLQGVPYNLVHATATVTFLLLVSQPMLEKLDRIKVKYGLVEPR